MLNHLKICISALAVSALFLAPAATVTLISADAVYAKNGHGNGNGNRGGNRGGGNGGGAGKSGDKGGDKGTRGNGNKGGNKSSKAKGNSGFKGFGKHGNKNKSAGKGGFSKGVKQFANSFKRDVGALFGKKSNANTRRVNRTNVTRVSAVSKSLRPPAARSARRAGDDKFGTLHPSQLGKLNGAINSSVRAKEAQIANGQYMNGTGPVSLAAALAVADYQYAQDLGAFNLSVETLELADAFNIIDGATEIELAATKAIFDTYDTNMDGLLSEEERNAAMSETEGTDTPLSDENLDRAQSINDANTLTDGQDVPSDAEIAEAKGIVDEGEPTRAAVEQAEDDLLAEYKGDLPSADEGSDMRLSEEERKVVDTVRDNNPDAAAIEEALGEYEDRT